MEEWKECTLGDICKKVYSGGTPKSTNEEYYTGGSIPWLNTKEVAFNRIYETENCITELGLQNSSAKWVPADTVIVAMYGATAGRSAITKIPLTTNQACCNLIVDKEKADYNFVYYYLYMKYNELASQANGGAQQNLNAKQVKEFTISLPPLPTQRKIASILSAIDDKVSLNQRMNENLEAQAQALFKSWFVDYEPWGGVRPKEWKEGCVGDFGKIVSGATPSTKNESYYTDNGISWITPKDLSVNKSKYIYRGEKDITQAGYDSCSAVLFPKYSVLFSSRAPIGYIAITAKEVCTNQGFKSIIPNGKIGTYFVYHWLKHNVDDIRNRASGSTFPEVSGKQLAATIAIIPDNNTLENFNNACSVLSERQKQLEQESSRLTTLRDTLLPRLMSGEIDVDNITI